MKSFEKLLRRTFDGVLQSATVLKMTGCLSVISEAAISICLRNKFYKKFLFLNDLMENYTAKSVYIC